VHLRYPLRHRERWRSTDENVKGSGCGVGPFPGDRLVAAGSRRAADCSCGVGLDVGGIDRPVFGRGVASPPCGVVRSAGVDRR
jgi:hypothetical protein